MKLIGTTVRFSRNYSKLCKVRGNKFKITVEEKIDLLLFSPSHNSLRLHKINHRSGQSWSVSIDMKIRMLFVYENDGLILVDIGTHDEVY